MVSLKGLQYTTLIQLIEREAQTEELILEQRPSFNPFYGTDTIYLGSRAGAFEAINNWEEAYLLVKRGKDNSFYVIPNPALMEKLKEQRARKRIMYISEALVLFILISAAFWWIFRSMNRIVSFNTRQNNFMLAITHELKTPLASIKLILQSLLWREWEKEKQGELMKQAVKEVDRLHTLVEDILTGVRLDNNEAYVLNRGNISKMVKESLELAKERFQQQGTISSNLEEEIFTSYEPEALNLALNNLLENAVKYSEGKAEIEVNLISSAGEIMLSVADKGMGIPKTERKNVLLKFYRAGNEETRSRQGTGLGLYITNEIVKKHKGKLIIEKNTPKGTIITIKIPKR